MASNIVVCFGRLHRGFALGFALVLAFGAGILGCLRTGCPPGAGSCGFFGTTGGGLVFGCLGHGLAAGSGLLLSWLSCGAACSSGLVLAFPRLFGGRLLLGQVVRQVSGQRGRLTAQGTCTSVPQRLALFRQARFLHGLTRPLPTAERAIPMTGKLLAAPLQTWLAPFLGCRPLSGLPMLTDSGRAWSRIPLSVNLLAAGLRTRGTRSSEARVVAAAVWSAIAALLSFLGAGQRPSPASGSCLRGAATLRFILLLVIWAIPDRRPAGHRPSAFQGGIKYVVPHASQRQVFFEGLVGGSLMDLLCIVFNIGHECHGYQNMNAQHEHGSCSIEAIDNALF